MFNKNSIFALNKKDPNAIVYPDANGNLIRLTCDDFSSEEEFLRWKSWSDNNFHGEENGDHRQANYAVSLEGLSEEAVAVPSAEDGYIAEIERFERQALGKPLLDGMGAKLTEIQRNRLWLYCVEGLTLREIADTENANHANVRKSILRAKEILKKFLENRDTKP